MSAATMEMELDGGGRRRRKPTEDGGGHVASRSVGRGMPGESGSLPNGAIRRRVPFAEIYALRRDGEKKVRGSSALGRKRKGSPGLE